MGTLSIPNDSQSISICNTMIYKLHLNNIVQRKKDLLESNIDDEKVMMSLENNEYYGLNSVASRIWELLTEKQSISSIVNQLMEEYDIDRENCEKDVLDFIQELNEKNLIQVDEA